MSLIDKLKNENQSKSAITQKDAEPVKTAALPTEPEVEEPEEKIFLYSTPHSPTYSIHLNGGTVKAHNGVLKLNEAQHKEVQTLIKKHQRYDIQQNMILLDPEAAAKIAAEHMTEAQKRKQAAKGMTSTSHSAARTTIIEGHEVPDKLSELKVLESEIKHAEDSSLDPDGRSGK